MVYVLGVRLSAFHMLSFFVNFITEIDKKKKKPTCLVKLKYLGWNASFLNGKKSNTISLNLIQPHKHLVNFETASP